MDENTRMRRWYAERAFKAEGQVEQQKELIQAAINFRASDEAPEFCEALREAVDEFMLATGRHWPEVPATSEEEES